MTEGKTTTPVTRDNGVLPAFPGIPDAAVNIGLNAAIISLRDGDPHILAVRPNAAGNALHSLNASLPFGPFTPVTHRTFEIGLRTWVKEQTGLDLGYVEQLYSFGDRGRHAEPNDVGPHVVSIGYLALTRSDAAPPSAGGAWLNWYGYFPWEDWRGGKPSILTLEIEPRLHDWAQSREPPDRPRRPLSRAERVRILFAGDGGWDDEKTLERFELLYEAGLMAEALRDGREAARAWGVLPPLGSTMLFDHRRILATAIGRLRAKIKYRPVVFELMQPDFTLYELQKTVEAISGAHVHKQNFRRLVETSRLVEPTGRVSTATGGRPAKVYTFRREVLLERPSSGVRVRPVK
ncbi:MAG: NAD regulator [Hyphomicrobiales bacterium]|nr:NAD regulator [Hyphomicrobiales bacterium]